MVCISSTRTDRPSAARLSAAFSAICTIMPVAITVTSEPSRRVTPWPRWKV